MQETIDATLTEVMRATREGIRINTFMLDATALPAAFIEQLTQLNQGRAFFTTPETLGDYVLVDFMRSAASSASGAPAEGLSSRSASIWVVSPPAQWFGDPDRWWLRP